MQPAWLSTGLLITGYCLEIAVVILLWKRSFAGRFSVLLIYVLVTLIGSVARTYGRHHWSALADAWFYWGKEAVIYVVSCLLVLSFWKAALESFRGVWFVLRVALPVLLLAMLGMIWWNAIVVPAQMPKGPAIHIWLLLANEALVLAQAVFLVGLFVVLGLFRVPMAPLLKKVAACWFCFQLFKIASHVLYVAVGTSLEQFYVYGQPVAFCILMAAWCGVLWTARPEDLQPPQPPSWAARHSGLLASDLEDVNRALSRLLKV